MRYSNFVILLSCLVISLTSCQHSCSDSSQRSCTESPQPVIARGADISWITEMEHDGWVFRAMNGDTADLITVIKEAGANAVRLRVWVHPDQACFPDGTQANPLGFSSKDDMLSIAKRVHQAGLNLMVDFHYSDWWADPGQQYAPQAWQDLSVAELCDSITAYTIDVLSALKAEGIAPLWVQIGNETTTGMCWPQGKIFNDDWSDNEQAWMNLGQMFATAYQAVKSVFPNAQVIIHHDNAFNTEGNTWYYERVVKYGGKFDIIGLSHYPTTQPDYEWWQMNEMATWTIQQLHAIHDCPIMLVEIGTQADNFEQSYRILQDMRSRTDSLDYMYGTFFWEPESYYRDGGYYHGYNKSAFNPDGTASAALIRLWK